MNTTELIESIINKEINYIDFFSDTNIGISKFKTNNDYYKELLNRSNALDIIYEMLLNEKYDEEYKTRAELLMNIINGSENIYLQDEELTMYSNDENIYTPNGSIVEFAYYRENTISDELIIDYHNAVLDLVDTLTEDDYILPASTAYNCHSYAWYEQDPLLNNYWINFPTTYIEDLSYWEVDDVRPGDIICYWSEGEIYINDVKTYGYYISHSGIVLSGNIDVYDNSTLSNINLISKWGNYGVYTYNGNECPYGIRDLDFRYVRAYRPRTDNVYNLSRNMNKTSVSKTINSNGMITDKYGMYELTVNENGDYLITIESNNTLDNKLFNVNMNNKSMTLLSSNSNVYKYSINLSSGIYYLRTAYSNLNNSGIISVSIESHSHSYEMQYYNYKWHKLTCECGQTSGNNQVHSILQSSIIDERYAPCIGCGYMLDLNSDMPIVRGLNTNVNIEMSTNGSYILPSGIIVLVDEDLDAYLNGTLVFNKKSKFLVIE